MTWHRSMNERQACRTGTPARHGLGDGKKCPSYDTYFSNDATDRGKNNFGKSIVAITLRVMIAD